MTARTGYPHFSCNTTGTLNDDDCVDEDARTMDEGDIPPRAWLTPQLCRKYITVLAAPGGAGKTTLAIALALSLAFGRPLIGEKVYKKARVLLITAEDGRDEIHRRFRAARMKYNIETFEPGQLDVMVLTGGAATFARSNDYGQAVDTSFVAKIEDKIRCLDVDAVIMDPFAKMAGVAENDNRAVNFVMRLLARIAEGGNVGILVLHHVRKGIMAAGNADMARGAKSLIDAARLAFTLTMMSLGEAKAFGVPKNERRQLVRLDSAKTNLTVLVGNARWFWLASVNLNNATPEYPDGDSIQAIEMRTPPDIWEGMSEEIRHRIFDDIDKGMPDGERYSNNNAAKERAAWKIIQEYVPGKPEVQCRKIINIWVESGSLKVEYYHSLGQRRQAKGLMLNDDKLVRLVKSIC